jgi:magnesium-transporting ATPase (P-type)
MYAQSAYFIAAILVQIANNIVSRTRYLSFSEHGLNNIYANLSFLFEICLGLFFVYVPFMNKGISTRPIAIPHFFIPAVTWAVLILIYDEMRKLLVRKGIRRVNDPEKGTMMMFDGWVARNTYY